MRRTAAILLSAAVAALSAACQSQPQRPEMYIEPAQLTEQEQDLAKLLGLGSNQHIFDFAADETARTIQINSYQLTDGEWDLVSGGGGLALDGGKGRIALGFEKISDGLRIAIQHGSGHTATSYKPSEPPDTGRMSCATSMLANPTEIEYDKEIALAVQVFTSKNEISSYGPGYFDTPEEYEKHGYDHVYAITAMLSQRSVAELDGQNQASSPP